MVQNSSLEFKPGHFAVPSFSSHNFTHRSSSVSSALRPKPLHSTRACSPQLQLPKSGDFCGQRTKTSGRLSSAWFCGAGWKRNAFKHAAFLKRTWGEKKNLYSCHVALRMYLWNPDWVVVSTCTYIYIYISLNTRQLFSDVVKKHPQESSAWKLLLPLKPTFLYLKTEYLFLFVSLTVMNFFFGRGAGG